MFNISVLLDVQANLPETSPFFICPNGFAEHLLSNVYSKYLECITLTTGTKAKRQQLQQGQNFRGSTLSEGSSNVGLLRGAAFGIQQEFMQFKNSLLEGKANISDAKQKRKRYKNNSQWVYVQAN